MSNYTAWFEAVAGFAPHPWQARLGDDTVPQDRLLRIPTGLGKSAGTILPWLHAVSRGDTAWPRRLVFVLPMRVLADQVAREAEDWIRRAKLEVPVHILMGGVEAQRWVEDLERPAILVGTQDMLLSRALNRGYASGRGLWSMELDVLCSDSLCVPQRFSELPVSLRLASLPASERQRHSVHLLRRRVGPRGHGADLCPRGRPRRLAAASFRKSPHFTRSSVHESI